MEQKYILGIVALTMVSILGVGAVSAFGLTGGFFGSDLNEEELTAMQAQHQAIQDAITNKDFETWKSLMEQEIAQMQAQLTEENFNNLAEKNAEMQEMRQAMQEARDEFCQENDCPAEGDGFGPGPGKMNRGYGMPFAETG